MSNYRLLACAIVKQAVMDYRAKRIDGERTNGISKFFNSQWCDALLGDLELSGSDILKHLKTETRLECLRALAKSGGERWRELYQQELER